MALAGVFRGLLPQKGTRIGTTPATATGRSFPRSLDFTDMNTVKTALLVFTLGSAISFAVAGLIMVISRAIHFAEQRSNNKS